jgi:hypothetical protein
MGTSSSYVLLDIKSGFLQYPHITDSDARFTHISLTRLYGVPTAFLSCLQIQSFATNTSYPSHFRSVFILTACQEDTWKDTARARTELAIHLSVHSLLD